MTKAAHICFTHELFSLFTLLQVSIPIPEIIIGTVIVNLGDGDTVGDGSAGPGAGGDGPAALHSAFNESHPTKSPLSYTIWGPGFDRQVSLSWNPFVN